MTTAIYLRVSSVSQSQASQRRAINQWLKGHGIVDPLVFTDKSTGANLDRPGFAALQQAIFDGTVKMVVVFKLDRISRSLRDGLNTLLDWIERGVRVVSVTQQLDFAGKTGQLIASVLFAVAEMEKENIKERQAGGIANAKEAGVYTGRKKGTTKASPKRAKQLRAKGLTLKEIAAALGVSRKTVTLYLREPKDDG